MKLLTSSPMGPSALAFRLGLPIAVFASVILAPNPEGLTDQGQRALAVMGVAVVLWATETLHIAVTGMVGIVLLVLVDAVDDVEVALYGFSQPVTYFLLGILTLGLAVHRSGLAERMAVYLIRLAGGSPKLLYFQMLAAFAGLTFALPSSGTRGAIMVHVYEQVLEHWKIEKSDPLNKAVMLAMGSLNRLASTALLAGGITPVVAAALIADFGLIDDFSWTRWFILMAVPFYLILILGGLAVFLIYRSGFTLPQGVGTVELKAGPVQGREIRAGLIALGTALLWFTDFAHGLPPVVPALIAMTVVLLPGVGLLSWREFEQNIGWTSIFVVASSLSLANALIISGGLPPLVRRDPCRTCDWAAGSSHADTAGNVGCGRGRESSDDQYHGLFGIHHTRGDVHRCGLGSEPGGMWPSGGSRRRLGGLLPSGVCVRRFYLPACGTPGPRGTPLGPDHDRDHHRPVVHCRPALLEHSRRKPDDLTPLPMPRLRS